MKKPVGLLIAILAMSYVGDAYKILVVFPLPSPSHSFLGNGIVRHLLKAGHEVTLITPYINKNPPKNLHQILITSLDAIMQQMKAQANIGKLMEGDVSVTDPSIIIFMTNYLATTLMEDVNIQKLLADQNQHFDLIIAEWLFNELYAGFHAVFNAPLIWFSSTEPETVLFSIIDEHINPSYNSFLSTPPETFSERVSELWYSIKLVMAESICSFLQAREYNRLIAPHITARGKVPPSFKELRFNASLVLANSHVSMGAPVRLPQMLKPIGGFHIDDEIKPLPEDLKKIMDNAKHGVIYFSMGSNLQSKDWPIELKRSFVKMFGTLKQTVLWKFEEVLPDLPSNLHILQWAPQTSILDHPNCVLFITHGGHLSTTETIRAGVPTIGIPAFGDQYSNVARAEIKGFAKKVTLSYTMTDDLKAAIEEVLTNPKYRQKAKELSFIFHDRPVKPGDELVHWAEHVVKTRGAPHLRSPALMVPWYQKLYLDLALLIIIVILVLRKVLKLVLPIIMPKRFKKQKVN